ncbi:DUF4436 domain-containing protein [Mycobacterium sp. Aquia_216]|uniref:DUF4436 domain-containing protein n=1 Tax=Mycobacterium sp. Aquia_216 TaxID=2991729 RepID=UPI00227D1A78|nr:DUF4436 domain-containing protein [Mycobacterium sp. Aquia_216]WAJ46214.1 DUF4436 domain-containing protein [Mycobacterium sp. Aquia_216]
MRWAITGAVVLVGAYAITIALYASTGLGRPDRITDVRPTADGTTVTIDVEELHSVKGTVVANLTVTPGKGLLDPITHTLKDDLSVAVASEVTTKQNWAKGMVPGVLPVALAIYGDPSEWPFDSYRSEEIIVELLRGPAQLPERVPVTFVDRLPGWTITVPVGNATDARYRLEFQRSPSTAAFASVMVAAMIVIAVLGLFVAFQTVRDRARFNSVMIPWYAAILFAVVPLRNALPDSPPIGFWIDITVVLWVIVVLVASMALYIFCWWRHEKEHAHQPH